MSVAISLAQSPKAAPASTVPTYGYKVINTYPHDANAFTQGLEYREGYLFEGTGLNGRSSLRRVALTTGQVLKQIPVDEKYFGEGITVFNRQVVELTWTSQVGFLYDQNSFRLIRTFNYPGEGWGLANDGQQMYMSDGSADIRIWDPQTFTETRRITVRDGTPIRMLNELEFVKGELFANVWQTDRIARISPKDGKVLGWIDLAGLLQPSDKVGGSGAVLNGIAYDPLGNRLFVTGKLWPKLFEIQLIEKKR